MTFVTNNTVAEGGCTFFLEPGSFSDLVLCAL